MSNEMIPATRVRDAIAYSWRGTKQQIFLQIADVVLPPIAARILTTITQTTTAAHPVAA